MLNRIKKNLRNFFGRVINDSQYASKTVVASILLISLFALTLDLGSQIAPQYLKSEVTGSADNQSADNNDDSSEDIEKPEEVKFDEEFAKQCVEWRKKNFRLDWESQKIEEKADYEIFLDNFEYSFRGILPGVSDEFDNNMEKRKDKLVNEIIRVYAKHKYCIKSEIGEDIFFDENTEDNYDFDHKLNNYIQVKLFEDDDVPLDIMGYGMITYIPELIVNAKDDLESLKIKIDDKISNAIKSAKEIDKRTKDNAGNAMAQTRANQRADALENQKKLKKIAQTSTLLQKENNFNDSFKIQGTAIKPSIQTPIFEAFLEIESALKKIEDLKNELKSLFQKDETEYSYGLLNLLDPKIAKIFVDEKAKKKAAIRIAANNGLDIFTPDPNNPGILEMDLKEIDDESQKCNIEGKEEECFGYDNKAK